MFRGDVHVLPHMGYLFENNFFSPLQNYNFVYFIYCAWYKDFIFIVYQETMSHVIYGKINVEFGLTIDIFTKPN